MTLVLLICSRIEYRGWFSYGIIRTAVCVQESGCVICSLLFFAGIPGANRSVRRGMGGCVDV